MTSCVKPGPESPGLTHDSLTQLSVYKKDGADLGVVFYVDPNDDRKGKAISAAGGLMQWARSNDLWRIKTYKENYDYVHTVITTSDRYIKDPDHFPAVRFCDEMRRSYGGNWHVPSLEEMNKLCAAYNGELSKEAERFDSLLVALGGDRLLGMTDKYWICAQNSNGNTQYFDISEKLNHNDFQTTEKYLRCVLDIDNTKSEDALEYPRTDVGKLLEGPLASKVVDILWDTTYNVTNGLKYYQMRLKTDAEEVLDTYLLRVDLSEDLAIRVAVARDTEPDSWVRETLTEMAAYINNPSKPVYAMVNGDFCDNRTPIRPRGPVHSNGEMLCTTFSLDPEYEQQGLSYVGLTYDGNMIIGPRDEYEQVKSTLKECTGAGLILIEDSKIVGKGSGTRDPRTAIGYTSENTVWILAVDGRHKGTEGMTYSEMSSIFFGLGCEAAVNLDGGGSTEMIARNPLTGKIEICNWPSDPTNGDGGQERPRPNAWAIVKK